MPNRYYSPLDKFIIEFDQMLRHITANDTIPPIRPSPALDQPQSHLTGEQKNHIAGLMRVNHAGEISAQALYRAQAFTARNAKIQEKMRQSAEEEIDHLAWCETRLQELNSHTSYLNAVWYAGSWLIGAFMGAIGDQWSLGFVVETERQVVKHLKEHLEQLPKEDARTRAILQQMETDESYHATVALDAGAFELPETMKTLMRWTSQIMTNTAYYL